MNDIKNSNPERRHFFRVVYEPMDCPVLTIEKNEFEISDISEDGIRFKNRQLIRFEKQVNGKVTFLDGEAIEIEGKVAWRCGKNCGLHLNRLIPYTTIEKELRQFV